MGASAPTIQQQADEVLLRVKETEAFIETIERPVKGRPARSPEEIALKRLRLEVLRAAHMSLQKQADARAKFTRPAASEPTDATPNQKNLSGGIAR
ncbi:hypothetical protein [Mangrovibrevibacter kandeliae]|uniref:hypothetical protein n=1 Tax=Mangrovibrevibacter kandeliae TaxID=2968473 RepID=UPI00211741E4|nr:hypothetical protein [Aurantimonas sp. CSK15Z-1]MCQ8781708.1 hypothetical protein [Aurantimonas sp. CSK15Z-1]